jgi:hypothetical protein
MVSRHVLFGPVYDDNGRKWAGKWYFSDQICNIEINYHSKSSFLNKNWDFSTFAVINIVTA